MHGFVPQATASPDLARAPIFHKRINRLSKHLPGGQAAAVAGYVGPGFHNWPSGHIPQDTAPNPLLRIRPHAKKTFGAATGVSDPRLQKTQTRNHHAGGDAATVAGDADPGFHNWPPDHIPQNNGSESAASQPVPC